MTGKKKLYLALAGAVLFVAAVLLLYRLDYEAFQDYDEATYAEITSESLAHGNFFALTFLNNAYFRKPPLLFWLTDASSALIPDQEFAVRLPGALAALALIALVMLLCYEASGSAAPGLLAGAILTATAAFIEPARQVRFDHLVSLFVVATFYAVLRARKDPRWYVAAGAFLGLAILAKGIIAIFAIIAVLAYALYARRNMLRIRYFWWGVFALLLVALPWHLFETYRYGFSFWQSYVGNEVIKRAQEPLFPGTNAPTNAGYAYYLLVFAAPWFEIFCGMVIAFPFLYRRIDMRVRSILLASITAVISVLVVMGASKTKAIPYLITLYPFMAVAAALFVQALWQDASKGIRTIIAAALLLCLPISLAFTAYTAFHLNPSYAGLRELSFEEKAVGKRIRATPNVPAVYVYQDDFIGSIQYYAALPFTDHPFLLLLSQSSTVVPGSLVATPVSESALAKEFPRYRFTPEYQGASVSLFRID